MNPIDLIFGNGLAGNLVYWAILLVIAALPAITAFSKGRGPWMIWALAFSCLTIFPGMMPVAFSNFGGSARAYSYAPWLFPGSIWSLGWLFTKLAIDERRSLEADDTDTR